MSKSRGGSADRAGAVGAVATPGSVAHAAAPAASSGTAIAGPVALGGTDIARIRNLLERLDPTLPLPGGDTDTASATGLSESQCIDVLRELEDLKTSAAGAQAAVTAHFATIREDAEREAGLPAAQRGKGLAGEVALARRVSPHRGGQHLGLARALCTDLPRTFAELRRGALSEWRATLLVRESICLSGEQRRAFDAELWADPNRLAGLGDRALVAEAKRLAYRIDPHSLVARAARAEQERCVSMRPAPDTMAYLTALLPVAQAVAVHAALKAAADSARAAGDERSRGQVMADTFVSRVTGSDSEVPAQVQLELVMTDHALLAGGAEPAQLPGHGTVPASWARDLLRQALAEDSGCGVWLQRVLTNPAGQLVAMESRSRHAPPGLAHYIALRDAGRCRTPWCDAPVRHIDHVVDYAAGGPTSADNLGGRCERCNYTKSRPGWRANATDSEGRTGPTAAQSAAAVASRAGPARAEPAGCPPGRAGPDIELRTPTGHSYRSRAPSLPRTG